MRLFLAISLEKKEKERLWKIAERVLRKIKNRMKKVEMENYHLTLKFFGDVEKEKMKSIVRRLKKIRVEKFYIVFNKIGNFGGRVLFLDGYVEEGEKLKKLIESLKKENLIDKRFSLHLTIARMKEVVRGKEKEILRGEKFEERVLVKRVSLMESFLNEKGPRYEERGFIELN